MARARIDETQGAAALRAWASAPAEAPASRQVLGTAVRWTLQALSDRAPGKSVEVRVPPFGAVQVVEGPGHTRGTPPNVIELDADTWLRLACGLLHWPDARMRASGTRADVSAWLPVVAKP